MAKTTTTTEGATLPPQFKSFDKTNTSGRPSYTLEPSIMVSKTGSFTLNRACTELLGLKHGDGLAFHFDDTKDEWYMERDNKNGVQLRLGSNSLLMLNSSVLRHRMKAQFPDDVENGRILVATEAITIAGRWLHALLMSSMKPSNRKSKA